MPRLQTVGRFDVGDVAVRVRADDPRLAGPLLDRWLRLPRSREKPQLTYDLLLTPRRKRLVRDGASHYAARRVVDVLDALELAVHTQLPFRTPYVPLHAAALLGDEGAVVLAGPSGAGKSSLAAELVQRGWGYLSDEMVFVAADLKVRGFPRAIAPDGGPGEEPPRPWNPLQAQVVTEPQRVSRVVLLQQPRCVGGGLEPRSGAEATAELARCLLRKPSHDDVSLLGRLVAAADAYALACEGIPQAVVALQARV